MTTQTIRKRLAVAALGLVGLVAAGAAQAGGRVHWSIGIQLPPVAVIGSNAPVYYPAPPVVYGPPPVVYGPPPVVYGPPPVYYEPRRYRPAPIVYHQPVPVVVHQHRRGHWRDGRWHDDRGWRGHDKHWRGHDKHWRGHDKHWRGHDGRWRDDHRGRRHRDRDD